VQLPHKLPRRILLPEWRHQPTTAWGSLNGILTGKTGTHWDDIPVDGVSPDDLDYESFAIFRREAVRNGRMT